MFRNFRHGTGTNSDRLCLYDQSSISGRIGACQRIQPIFILVLVSTLSLGFFRWW